MATANELLSRTKQVRGVDDLVPPASEPGMNVPDTLSMISKFLQDHETASINDCTHVVFDNYHDWWMGPKTSYKLAIAEDNTVETLNRYITILYDLNIPLTLTEKQTPAIRFAQDVEIWGDKDVTIVVEDLMRPHCPFARMLGKIMGEIFPGQKKLDLIIFDSTGTSGTKGIKKTSIRLVWREIIVDKERAVQLRDYVVHKFKYCQEEEIKELEKAMQSYSKDNQWSVVFNDAIYFDKHGLRMPLNDRVSPVPLQKPERRPFVPFGIVRYTYQGGEMQDAAWLGGKGELNGPDWLKIGSVRQDAGTPLTEAVMPAYKGERAPGTCTNSLTSTTRRNPGQVRLRTRGGSDGRIRVRRDPQKPSDCDRSVTVEREFEGDTGAFLERMEQSLGNEGTLLELEPGIVCWRQSVGDGARIEFKATNHRVYIIGKHFQIRPLLNVIAPFAKELGKSVRSIAGAARSGGTHHKAGSEYDGGSSVYQPSAVYAPSSVLAPSQAYAGSSASCTGSVWKGQTAPSRRIASGTFEPQAQGELALCINDFVTVTHDPEKGHLNLHRWVYGLNENSKQRGWFPFSHTKPVQLPSEASNEVQEN